MKKVSLLLVTASLAWLTGCEPETFPFFLPDDDMKIGSVYCLTAATIMGEGTLVPPEISGTIKFDMAGTYVMAVAIPGVHIKRSGTYDMRFEITEDAYVIRLDGGEDILRMPLDSLRLHYRLVYEGRFIALEFSLSPPA